MTTTATFDLATDDDDDDELRELVEATRGFDEVAKWSVAVFVCTLLRDRALKAQGVHEYHDRLKARRAETRAAAQPTGKTP